MKYKLVAIDIDGTLIDHNNEIPQENIQTIRELTEKGVHFVIVTGRPDTSVKEYVNILGIKAPVLGCNGATIREVVTGEVYSTKSIQKDLLIDVYNYFTSKGLYPRYYGLDTVYSFNPNEFDEKLNSLAIFSKKLATFMPFRIIDNIDYLLNGDENVIKVSFISENDQELKTVQNEFKKIEGLEPIRASKVAIDIIKDDVSKGDALLSYAKSLGIEKEEIIAIGDGENDLSMLEAVGFPVTLENGEDCLKRIAKLITVNNNQAGVAKALKEIFGYNEDGGNYSGI